MERDKTAFEDQVRTEFDAERRTLAERAQAEATRLAEERKSMLAQFQKMVEDHRIEMDKELQANAEKVERAKD